MSTPARLDEVVSADVGNVPVLRRAARAYADALGVAREQAASVALAVTEAATNAVLHAYVGRLPGTIRVLAEPADGALVVRVIDDGGGFRPRYDSPGVGLGLPTIGSLTTHLDITTGPGGAGTEVRMVFDAPGLRSPSGGHQGADRASRLHGILGAVGEAVTVSDASGRVLYANRAAAELLGARSVEEVLSAPSSDWTARFAITREDGSSVTIDDLPNRRVLAEGSAEPLLTRSVHLPTGRAMWVLTSSRLLEDGGERLAVNTIRDVTETKEAERRQRFLARAGEELALSLEPARTFERIARLAVPEIADWCAVDLLGPDGGLQRAALAHVNPEKLEVARRIHARYPPEMDAERGIGRVLRTGEADWVADLSDDLLARHAKDEEHLRLLRGLGMRSAILAPLAGRSRAIGVLTLVSADSGRTFTDADVALATELGRRAGLAVENAWLYAGRS